MHAGKNMSIMITLKKTYCRKAAGEELEAGRAPRPGGAFLLSPARLFSRTCRFPFLLAPLEGGVAQRNEHVSDKGQQFLQDRNAWRSPISHAQHGP